MASGFSALPGTLDKSHWALQINEIIDENALDAASQTPISVFQLPDSVRDGDPAAYLPRRVALGPYHHFRPDLYKMDLFKLGKAKNLKWGHQLHQLADQLKPLELRIRACFDQSLEMDRATLSWVMLIDGLFLLELLQNRYNRRPLKLPLKIFYGKLWSEFEIVSDMLKLENQIPLFVLEEICPEEPMKYLAPLLYQFSASVSPFELPSFDPEMEFFGFSSNLPEIYNQSHHLLHFLYLLVLLIPSEVVLTMFCADTGSMVVAIDTSSSVNFLSECLSILGSVINIAFIQQVKETFSLIQRLFRLLGSVTKSNLVEKKTPLIPSASDLKNAGVTFKSTKNGILKCRFNETTLTLTLPSIHLDGFSQVLLRNLVAFEAMAEVNPPCLVQYTALMNGLLTNSKDLKILEEAKIVHNHLNSEEEAVEVFNGVENSTSSLKKESVLKIHLRSDLGLEIGSEFLQEMKMNYDMGLGTMVEEMNRCYGSCSRMKMKEFFAVVLKCFAILVIVFLIVLVSARLVCSFVRCPVGIFKTSIALHQMY